MLSEEGKILPRRTKARLLVGKFLITMGYKIWPEEFFESVQREELVQMSERIDGVECSVNADAGLSPCPHCGRSDKVREEPEAGYWICKRCGEPGSGPGDDINWWRNDPDSQWYVGPDAQDAQHADQPNGGDN
ncbi:primase-helicase zinc-binding domain-containing protein [Halostagnicola larsenii]|nr:primase-helicase zinc-binding domain-containing protein [Halostagnicola larsenii]